MKKYKFPRKLKKVLRRCEVHEGNTPAPWKEIESLSEEVSFVVDIQRAIIVRGRHTKYADRAIAYIKRSTRDKIQEVVRAYCLDIIRYNPNDRLRFVELMINDNCSDVDNLKVRDMLKTEPLDMTKFE